MNAYRCALSRARSDQIGRRETTIQARRIPGSPQLERRVLSEGAPKDAASRLPGGGRQIRGVEAPRRPGGNMRVGKEFQTRIACGVVALALIAAGTAKAQLPIPPSTQFDIVGEIQ